MQVTNRRLAPKHTRLLKLQVLPFLHVQGSKSLRVMVLAILGLLAGAAVLRYRRKVTS